MKKFDIHVCTCGRIHAIPIETVRTNVLDNGPDNKDIALVCDNCKKIVIIGATYGYNLECEFDDCDIEPEDTYDNYSYEHMLSADYLDTIEFDKPTVIIHSEGITVPMMNGFAANSYDRFGGFYNCTSQVLNTLSHIVNMPQFVNENSDDVLESISSYMIEGLDWTGTKFDVFN